MKILVTVKDPFVGRVAIYRLILQNATSKKGWGGRCKPPFAFTEHGAIMLAAVLNSPIAVQASIQVVRVFVRLRQMLASNTELSRNLAGTTRMAYKTAREFSSRFIPENKAIRCY